MAINESTIPQNIENLELQRKHHENIQPIIARQKHLFEDFLRRNGLKAITEPEPQQNPKQIQSNKVKCDGRTDTLIDAKLKRNIDDEYFSLFEVVGELKINENDSDDETMYPAENDDTDEGDEQFFSLL